MWAAFQRTQLVMSSCAYVRTITALNPFVDPCRRLGWSQGRCRREQGDEWAVDSLRSVASEALTRLPCVGLRACIDAV